MNIDPTWISTLIGRYGTIFWSICAFILQKTGYAFGAEDQAAANAILVEIAVGLAGATALISKARQIWEHIKASKAITQ